MGCTAGTVRCILNIINVFWALLSILMLVVAGFTIGEAPGLLVYIMFITGGIGLIASIFGFCGICHENTCLTTTYAVFIFFSLLAQIYGIVFATKVEGIRKYADRDVDRYWEQERNQTGAMDFLQETFKCCGKNGPGDYFELLNRTIPVTCYRDKFINQNSLYTTGCTIALEETYVKMVNGKIGGSWASIIFTVIILIFSIYLILRFRSKNRHYNY